MKKPFLLAVAIVFLAPGCFDNGEEALLEELETNRQQIKILQEKYASVELAKAAVERQLQAEQTQFAGFKTRIDGLIADREKADRDAALARRETDDIAAKYRELQEKLQDSLAKREELLKLIADQQKAFKIAKEHELNATRLRIEAEKQLTEARGILAALKARGVDISPPPAAPAPVPKHRICSKVLRVDAANGIAMLSVGYIDGVSLGMIFEISRGDAPVARARVEKVYDDMSAVFIMPESLAAGTSVREGDNANAPAR
ncbi:MAG: hypothetical protein JW909_11690 [Planctomycetes bacterium]|nr:hypothetical protein [Planctomycetota bacterium]